MKKIIVWLCILALLPTIFITAFCADPFDSSEVDSFTEEKSDGTTTTKNTLRNQFYRFQLWESMWNNPIGGTGKSYLNEATVHTPTVAGRIRPFGQNINSVNIGTEVDQTISSGFYLPLGKENISRYDFFLGLNIKMLSPEYIPLNHDQVIYGTFYLYFIDANSIVKYKSQHAFRYQWSWHRETDTLEMYCLLSIDIPKASLPEGVVGIVPVYTFRTIQLGAIGTEQGGDAQTVFIFFPQFWCTYNSSLYDNLWDSLIQNGISEGGLLAIGGSGLKALLSTFGNMLTALTRYMGALRFASTIFDEISTIPFFAVLIFGSLAMGAVGSFLGFGVVLVKSNLREESKNCVRTEKRKGR